MTSLPVVRFPHLIESSVTSLLRSTPTQLFPLVTCQAFRRPAAMRVCAHWCGERASVPADCCQAVAVSEEAEMGARS